MSARVQTHTPSALPLQLFDNSEYDDESNRWKSLLLDGARITGELLREDGTWHACQVLDINQHTNLFEVLRQGNASAEWVPRLQLRIGGEPLSPLAQRIQVAHARRAEAEAMILYHLSIDSMPTDDIPPLTVEQTNRIMGK
eukprot:scaffold2645_cov378-Prasinococcus_capsulatus_cf.AAC.25